jgi:neurofibromin 1
VEELLHAAVDAGMGSDKAECAGDILVSLNSISVRGRIVARLRKVSRLVLLTQKADGFM